MKNKFLIYSVLTIFNIFSIDLKIKESRKLESNVMYRVYKSEESPLVAHVINIPISMCNIKLVPAIGQRELVSSIAKRTNSYIAINGSNYRRGGIYNGNRLNLLYLNGHIYSDLKLDRGSFGWNENSRKAVIDKVMLNITCSIDKKVVNIDQVNQPRSSGNMVLYNQMADRFLLANCPGKNIIIGKDLKIKDITYNLPGLIFNGEYIIQVDKDNLSNIKKGMEVKFNFKLQSSTGSSIYNKYNFIIGGAGLLIHKDKLMFGNLYDEFSQGEGPLHFNDEIAADFNSLEMQQWLIDLRHPITAIGINKKDIYIVIIDGRQPNSEGLSLKELAIFTKNLGCTDALNIGGGGCSTLCVNGKVINITSNNQEERPVSEALCFSII